MCITLPYFPKHAYVTERIRFFRKYFVFLFHMYFDSIHSPPLTLFRSTASFYPSNIVSFCFKPHQDQSVLPKYSWICGFLLECDQLTGDYTLRETCLSLS